MARETSNRRRNLALVVGALLVVGAVLGRRSLVGRASGDGGGGGCEGKDYRERGAETGTVRQGEGTGIEPGQVIAGAQAALSVIRMIRTYAKYGELQITNGMILDKLNEVQASIVQLRTKTDAISNGQNKINANIFKAETITIIGAIDNLFSHYTFLRGKDAGDLTTFYQKLLDGVPDGYGTLNLGDLDALATLGQEGLPYLADFYGAKGTDAAAIAGTTDVGEYAASLQLRLAEGFYLLALAKRAQGTDGDFGPQGNVIALNEKRLANLGETFLAANDRMNQRIVTASRAAREAAISGCYWEYCINCDKVSFDDSMGTPTKQTFANQNGPLGSEKTACAAARLSTFSSASSAAGIATMQALLAAQPTFAHWSDAEEAADGGAPTIHVKGANYGTADVSSFLQSASNNRVAGAYTVDSKKLGDSTPTTPKAFSVTHTCGVSPISQTLSIPAEANGNSVTLRCLAPVDMSSLVGTWKTDQPELVQGTAQVTLVDANTVNFARSDGIAGKLVRVDDPRVLDIGKDSMWYFLGSRQVTLGRDAMQKVDTITFVFANGTSRYRFVP